MKSMWKILGLLLILAVFACQEELKLYRIGAIIPLTGDFEAYGRSVKSGLSLGLDEINSKGGINNKNLDILFEDDKSNEKTAVDKANELVRKSEVTLIIGGITS